MTKTLFDHAAALVTNSVASQRAVNKLCRRGDPETSYEAAEKMVKSGNLNRQEQKVLNAIKTHLYWRKHFGESKDFTAKELNYSRGINYYTIQRRLSGLHNKGKIERTGEKRDGCMVWRLAERKT